MKDPLPWNKLLQEASCLDLELDILGWTKMEEDNEHGKRQVARRNE